MFTVNGEKTLQMVEWKILVIKFLNRLNLNLNCKNHLHIEMYNVLCQKMNLN